MQEIVDYLKNKKRSFDDGAKLYNKYGKEIVPDFSKYKTFFADVNKDNKTVSQGILDTKLGYIVRMGKQFDERSKKKKDIPQAIKTESDFKDEDPKNEKKK